MTETLADSQDDSQATSGCPVAHARPNAGTTNEDWWPEKLNLKILAKNPDVTNPRGADFVYADAFNSLDLAEVKKDIATVLTDSKDWWPADFGHYGPFMIRMAWHSAGTYRVMDGRGGGSTGQQRFAPLNSWPDNVHLDKARRLLWPVKKKYGKAISWADLMILTGNVALETMGLKTYGFGGGRIDAWEPDDDVYWGAETTWLGDDKRDLLDGRRDLENPLAAVQMGLIYVNPEGPGGNSDPLSAAAHIRETFARMAMDDEETVALIAGGHTFGKTHGAGPAELVGPEPEAAPIEQQDLGWKTSFRTGKGADAVGSGLEVTWTDRPIEWTNRFFEILFEHEWELEESPAGAKQWVAKNAEKIIPPPNEGGEMRLPTMLTTDLTLRMDPEYEKISRRFLADHKAFEDAFVRAWYKLTHRDMGPVSRYLGPEVPTEELIWQDPLPEPGPAPTAAEIATVKSAIEGSGLSPATLVRAAFASAGSYRASDMRGGANGARVRLEPMKDFEVNNPKELASTLEVLEKAVAGTNVSLADAIVLAGNVGVEQAAAAAGTPVEVPFTPGRVDASLEQTDVESFTYLEPTVDGFRNYISSRTTRPAEFGVVDRANQLDLSAPEMTVLVGGMRAIGATWDGSSVGVLTDRPGQLTNDFFVNLLDLETTWAPSATKGTYDGVGPKGQKWQGTRADLLFGANSELRAVAEVYAEDGSQEQFLADFVAAWVKVMDNDRFDVKKG